MPLLLVLEHLAEHAETHGLDGLHRAAQAGVRGGRFGVLPMRRMHAKTLRVENNVLEFAFEHALGQLDLG